MKRPERHEFYHGRQGEMDFNDMNRKYIDYLESMSLYFAEDEQYNAILIFAQDIDEAEEKLRKKGYTTCIIDEFKEIIK